MKTVRVNKGVIVAAMIVATIVVSLGIVGVFAKYIGVVDNTVKISIEKPHYTIIFDANAGDDETTGEMANQVFTYDTAENLTKNTYKRENYVFTGWNTAADNTGTAYADEAEIFNLTTLENDEITLYAQWEYSPMPVVFSVSGVCEFHGEVNGVPQGITGDDCPYAGQTYIDTGEYLYNAENYEKDFEIGFKIVEYNSSENVAQATFVNAKYESGSDNRGNPGIVVRKNTSGIEITQMINNNKALVSFPAGSVTEVKLVRIDQKVYYSVNGGDFVQLQSNVGTSDYHNIPTWFGAAPTDVIGEDGNYVPHRYIKAKLSDIYIKVGNYDSIKRTVTYNANGDGATVSPAEKIYIGDSRIGSMPVPQRPGHAFIGWYTEAEGGTKVRSDYVVTSDINLYAHWTDDTNICETQAGGNVLRGESLSDCITAAGTAGAATITVLTDIHENVEVNAGQDITFNLGDNVWSDGGNAAVITNKGGKIHIINGTITSSQNNAVINNEKANGNSSPTPELYITGGNIIATGLKQAVYNVNGYVEISGGAYLSSTSTSRATVQSKTNGEIVILGGTIESKGHAGVNIETSSKPLVIGVKGDGIDVTTPVIRGVANAIIAGGNLKFYDGILMSGDTTVVNQSKIIDNDGTLTGGTTEIDGVTYYTLYNE